MYQFCPNMKLIMVSEWEGKPRYLDLMHVRCKQWKCPFCAPVNASLWKRYLMARLNNAGFAGRRWALITLTANENAHRSNPIQTIINLQRTWKRMYDRLRSYNGSAFDYVRVFEKHTKGKHGGYHLHVVCDLGECYQQKKRDFQLVLQREKNTRKYGKKPRKRLKREKHPARWIKDACRACGGGFIADFRPIEGDSNAPVRYTMKYATKQLAMNEFPRYVRRIQASRAIGSPKRKGALKSRVWRAKSAIFRDDFQFYEKIIDVSLKREVTEEKDFSNGEHYYPPFMA